MDLEGKIAPMPVKLANLLTFLNMFEGFRETASPQQNVLNFSVDNEKAIFY
jgi:hypothetical protein